MSRPMRKHQVELRDIASDLVSGLRSERLVTLDCTPGGGKTGAATLFINQLLDANIIDRALWVVPRLSLAEQVCQSFGDGVGSCQGRELSIAERGDELFAPVLPNMPKRVGHVTTYQTLAHGKNEKRFETGVRAGRTLLILDEVQFLADDERKRWAKKIRPIFKAAKYQLLMSGTLWRTDNVAIPFINYSEPDISGARYPFSDITYTVRDAVAEEAILPTEWKNFNGDVEYEIRGEVKKQDLLENDPDDEETYKVRAFLQSDTSVFGLIDQMVSDWVKWCKTSYESRMIVIADGKRQAKRISEYISRKYTDIPCVLSITGEDTEGRELQRFRKRNIGKCLVTVARAYVGFDCPDLTHLAYLSRIRSPTWMLQSFARVSRVDHRSPLGYSRQHAFIFAPDDKRMRLFMKWLRQEERMGIQDREKRTRELPISGVPVGFIDTFNPIDATINGHAIESVAGRINPDREQAISAFVSMCPQASGIPYSKLNEILERTGFFGKANP